jgi:hypothetical protein
MAETRDEDAVVAADVEQILARARGDAAAIDGEGDAHGFARVGLHRRF